MASMIDVVKKTPMPKIMSEAKFEAFEREEA